MKLYKLKDDLQTKKLSIYVQTVMASVCDRFFVLVFSSLILLSALFGCKNRKELIDEPLFEGPTISMDSVYTKMSDSAELVMTLRAAKQNDYEGGDREWPESFYLEYMDDQGNVSTTFKADYVYYTAKENLYKAEGNVIVKNLENGDELNTEELFWSPSDEEFYTERFVTIQTDDEIHTGEGLTANQDFSSYKILKPQGTLLIEE